MAFDPSWLIVDYFAGGGGASQGIEQALGRPVDVAVNHDPEAVAMHAANHPGTEHRCQSVYAVDPDEIVGRRVVGLAWFSPDCKHFSKAKGGQPVSKNIRDLAGIVPHFIKRLGPDRQPRVIILENVEEFRTWGPLADDGQPCPQRKGETFDAWVRQLRRAGYSVQWRELRACDYGAPTSRKRLYLVARCDGQPIVWPAPTHGKPGSPEVLSGKRLPWRTAAEIIDWSIPCPSIFTRARPLKDATCRRIAAGVMRYVVNAARPFIVSPSPLRGEGRGEGTHAPGAALVVPVLDRQFGKSRGADVAEPLPTITAGGSVAAFLHKYRTGSDGQSLDDPAPTITANSFIKRPGGAPPLAVTAVHLAQFSGTGDKINAGHDAREPVSTIVNKGPLQAVVASSLVKLRGTSKDGQPVDVPLHTISAGGDRGGIHFAEVSAFLVKYYGNEAEGHSPDKPIGAVTTKDRFGLVTVTIDGEDYVIVDIGMRMLTPRELARAQGFPDSYELAPIVNGKPLTKTAQIRMIGNSVCPPMSEALVRAQFGVASAEAIAA